MIGLNIASANENDSATAAPIKNSTVITTVLPASSVNPAIGYGHFNVSNCILLDISCSVSVDLHVRKEVSFSVSYVTFRCISKAIFGPFVGLKLEI